MTGEPTVPASRPFSERAAEKIRLILASGPVQASTLARALHMSVRTLQRRLDAEGTSFQVLFDAVRGEIARQRLEQPTSSVTEVARQLGYENRRAFLRAFRRWTGVPLHVVRSSVRAEPGVQEPATTLSAGLSMLPPHGGEQRIHLH